MKILVTGGAGFIGSHVVDAYLELGHAVSVLDNLSTGREKNINPEAAFYRVDVRDTDRVEEIFRKEKFDVVNHHAAQMDIRRSVADPVEDASINILGALSLLECCVKTDVKRFIFASSGGAVYGEQDAVPADEMHPTRPISPYGVAKLTTEHYLFYYRAVHDMFPVCLRYANVYGPRQNPDGEAGVVAIFTSKMLRGEAPTINGDGTQTRDYVYVADVARANALVLGMDGADTFNIGTGIETDVNRLFRALRTVTAVQVEERHGEAKKGEQVRSVLNCSRIAGSLGWRPSTVLEEGLRKTVAYFRSGGVHAP